MAFSSRENHISRIVGDAIVRAGREPSPSICEMTILPGPIRQVGYIVNDLDAALASWVALGVGPWFVMRGMPIRALYRGAPCEIRLTLALANSGEMQIELLHPDDDTPSIYTEFLAAGHEGYHQLAYWTEDFGATMNAVAEAGWPVVWLGGEDLGARFAYIEPPNSPATIIELMELNEATIGMGTFIRDAAAGWDGTDPIRVLSG
jgi:catechol 2,3-dioxygenase-like lactoylglutathione lyase family enzyme